MKETLNFELNLLKNFLFAPEEEKRTNFQYTVYDTLFAENSLDFTF